MSRSVTLPLATLIVGRLAELGINTHGLAARLGYVNTNKGSRRLQRLMEGGVAGQDELLSRLAAALEVSPEEIASAIRANEAAREQAYRASFVPHAVIVTERRVPSQITFCAMTRGETALRIALDTTRSKATYARQALIEMNHRTESGRREIPFFGRAEGLVVYYDWCRAVRYDLDGRALELLRKAAKVGVSAWEV